MRFKLFIIFGFMLNAIPAAAQFGFGGDGVIDVVAEEATYKGGVTVLKGDVVVKQGDSTIASDKMTIYRVENANSRTALSLGEITRIVAEGKFIYDSPENKVTGDRGFYSREKNQLDIFGNVVLKQQSGNLVRSDSLFYDLKAKRARFNNECKGSECGRINFKLNNKNQ